MGWKEDAKGSSWNFNKDSSWNVPIDNFKIKVEGNKIQYNEGTWISSADDPHFDYPLSGPPITDDHIPCGYWHRDYAPMVYEIVTSELYPYELYDSMFTGEGELIGGEFRSIVLLYIYPVENINTLEANIIGGVFKSTLLSYTILPENINTYEGAISGGNFRQVLKSYIVPPESINTLDASILSGVFRDILISYENWPAENINTNEGSIIGGNFAST